MAQTDFSAIGQAKDQLSFIFEEQVISQELILKPYWQVVRKLCNFSILAAL